jgi:phage shock protein A
MLGALIKGAAVFNLVKKVIGLLSGDPESVLRRLVDDMKEGYREAEAQVAAAKQDEATMRTRMNEAAEEQAKKAEEAKKARAHGDQVAANAAEADADKASKLEAEWSSQLTRQTGAVAQLEAALAAMAQKIQSAEKQMKVLLARRKSMKHGSNET